MMMRGYKVCTSPLFLLKHIDLKTGELPLFASVCELVYLSQETESIKDEPGIYGFEKIVFIWLYKVSIIKYYH